MSAAPPISPPPEAPTMAQGAAAWTQLTSLFEQRARLDAQIIDWVGDLQRSGTIEQLEGVTFDTALALTQRMPRAERSMLLTAAEVLPSMPATRHLLATGLLSWGQVRGIVAEARRLSREERGWLDDSIGASADRIGKYDPDELIDQIRIRAAEARGARAVERSEQAQQRANFVWGQAGMFDRGKFYGEMDNLSLAAALNRFDEAAPPDDGRSLAQRRADGLLNLVGHTCDGAPADEETQAGDSQDAAAVDDEDARPTGGTAAPAAAQSRPTRHPRLGKPQYNVVISLDWRDVTLTSAGLIQINAPGCLPTISAALLEAIASDATVQAVICDGARPLTVTKKVRAKQITDDVRLAVRARDRRDRFPGSRRPIRHLHHRDKDGLGHHIDHLIGLADISHQRVHRFGWDVTLDPATGEVTFTRGDRSWTTLPRGTPLRRLPPPDTPATPPTT